jgi:hypothetical protein
MLGMSGQSTSVLDDIVGAFVSVGRTLLAIVLAIVAVFAGLIVLVVGGAAWLCFWLGYKLRLTKIPPKARYQRLQMWLVGKYVQRKLRKSGMMPPGGGNPFAGGGPFPGASAGGAGQPDMSQFFQGPMAEMFEQMQRDARRVRIEQAKREERGKRPAASASIPTEKKPVERKVAASAQDANEIPEVTAEEVGEFQGSVEELIRRKRG